MIFAELEYSEHYDEMHAALVAFIESKFEKVESGHQGDSWVWIFSGGNKVAIDTFSSMKHQVKSDKVENELLRVVIDTLQKQYKLKIFNNPEPEAHEDD